MDSNKVTYSREEGGFTMHVNGKPVATFRIKGWMNNLREMPEVKPGPGKINPFLLTQYEYHGKFE